MNTHLKQKSRAVALSAHRVRWTSLRWVWLCAVVTALLLSRIAFGEPQRLTAIEVRGDTAFLAHQKGLTVVDVSDHERVRLLGSFEWEGIQYGAPMCMTGETVYVGSEVVHIMDVSDPVHPESVGILGSNITDFAVGGPYLYAAGGEQGLLVYDITEPSSPAQVGNYPGSRVVEIKVVGDLAFTACYTGGVHVFDISDPRAPSRIGVCTNYTDAPYTWHLAVADGYVFVIDDELHVLDATDPANPVYVATYKTELWSGRVNFVKTVDNLTYLGGYDGLEIVDASTPTNMVKLGHYFQYDSGSWVKDLAFLSNIAYVASADGLAILDLSDPTSPVRIGPLVTPPPSWEVIQNLPTDAYYTDIISSGDSSFVCVSTLRDRGSIWGLTRSPGDTHRCLPYAGSLRSSWYANGSGFVSVANAIEDGALRILASHQRGVSYVNLDPAETNDVLETLYAWSWDPSYIHRIVDGKIGFGIANYGSRSGANGVELVTGYDVRFSSASSYTAFSTNGVTIYRTADSNEVAAIRDRRGVGWTDDIQLQLGTYLYSSDAGATWMPYLDENGNALYFYDRDIWEYNGRLAGECRGLLYVGRIGERLSRVDFPYDVRRLKVDRQFGRLFVNTQTEIYYTSIDSLAPMRCALETNGEGIRICGQGGAAPSYMLQTRACLGEGTWSNLHSITYSALRAGYTPVEHPSRLAYYRLVPEK